MSKTESTPKRVGTQMTESIIGSAAKALSTAVKSIEQSIEKVKTLEEVSNNLTLAITDKELKIEELKAAYIETERRMSVDLDLNMKAKTESTINQYLLSNGIRMIKISEFEEIVNERDKLKVEMKSLIDKEVAIKTSAISATFKAAAETAESNHKIKEAENVAKISSLEWKISSLEGQVDSLRDMIDSEREAGIERAKAASVGSINVTSGK